MYSVSNSWMCRHFLFTSMAYGVTIHNCTYVVTVVMATKTQLSVAIYIHTFCILSSSTVHSSVCIVFNFNVLYVHLCRMGGLD